MPKFKMTLEVIKIKWEKRKIKNNNTQVRSFSLKASNNFNNLIQSLLYSILQCKIPNIFLLIRVYHINLIILIHQLIINHILLICHIPLSNILSHILVNLTISISHQYNKITIIFNKWINQNKVEIKK